MKKKSTSKSKDRDKSKSDESKSHKHSRRKRRSSSSESEDEPSEVQNDLSEDVNTKRASRKRDKDVESNTAGGARITRHSKRLAAISASSDDAVESTPELLSPAKTGKSSPYSSGSPSKESKKKDGTPDKHRAKETKVWKVESANGAGSGEIQKLKISLQRSAENKSLPSESDDNKIVNEETGEVTEGNVPCETVIGNNINVEEDSIPLPNDEDVSNIQLPPADFSDEQTNSLPEEPNMLVEKAIEIVEESEKSDEMDNVKTIYEIVDVELPPEPEPDIEQEAGLEPVVQKKPEPEPEPESKFVVQDKVESKPEPDSESVTIEQMTEVVQTEDPVSDVTSKDTEKKGEAVSLSAEPRKPEVVVESERVKIQPELERSKTSIFDPVEEASAPAVAETEVGNNAQGATEIEVGSRVAEPGPGSQTAKALEADSRTAEESVTSSETAKEVEASSETAVGKDEGSQITTVTEEGSQPAVEFEETSHVAAEADDGSQAELVLTVEENVMDEPGATPISTECDERETEPEKIVKVEKTKSILPTLSQVEMEEVYDYEHDDTKEEGELSANEAMSPIHEVFKKLPAESRKRSWGTCNVFHFGRTNIIANEQMLKEYNIKKRTVSKEDMDASDPEDLIFVKEIREENIVHEIESETNNASFNEKDNDELSSPTKNVDSLEVRKKNTLESDKIKDKPSKRYVKSSKPVNGEGKTVLYITNLVRPFTVNQLRELLQRTGKIVEDGFWIDSIKSKCYVQFETDDQATETRHALHGIRWPVNNPKVLSVHFATQDELLAAQAQTHESEIPRKTEPLVIANHNSDLVQKRIDWKKHFEQYDERPRKMKDVREWDIGKPAHPDEMIYEQPDLKKEPETDASGRTRRDKRKRNEPSDDESRTKRHRKVTSDTQPPAEAKLLDDLFKRTKASPSIYWLPLSDEQIAVKQEARRKHLDDINRQMKRGGGDRDPRRRDRERRRSRR